MTVNSPFGSNGVGGKERPLSVAAGSRDFIPYPPPQHPKDLFCCITHLHAYFPKEEFPCFAMLETIGMAKNIGLEFSKQGF